MKRQTEPQGVVNLWVGQALDVDPFQRPQKYSLACQNWVNRGWGRNLFNISDEIIIGKYSILVRRLLMGRVIRQTRLPLSNFEGIAIRITCLKSGSDTHMPECLSHQEGDFAISINLHHEQERYCLPLYFAFDMDVSTARLQTWSRLLRLPILLPTLDGGWRQENPDMGKTVKPTARHPRFYLASRKPLLSYFRDVGTIDPERKVRGREMIAPD